ncbi:undecaprenyl/decaprenyl-phosphate alpha-N-acetylglucosaminyl 1-phosphate transferase [Alphaproteobacteria bacterium]|nr:undecaprenyl/decaprenyl-phosphate alpha-N-acetylglucosaminyl 1-phosphate transferase [Alphaproteobacteria bacterium]
MLDQKIIFILIISSLVTLATILLLRPLAIKLGIVDMPTKRKLHQGNIPIIGGICIFIGMLVSIILELRNENVLIVVIVSSFCILILGFIDDCRPLSVIIKVLFQLTIVSLMVWFTQLNFDTFGHSFGLTKQISLGFLSYPVTIVGIVFVTNAFNLMDGSDGLAGSLAFLAIIGINIVEFIFLGSSFNIISLAIAGSLIPFLWFNLTKLYKHKIFLGDCGSLFLGYIIACLLLNQTQTNNNISPTMSLWIVAVPIFDVIAVMIYRIKNSNSLFTPDRSHLHYFLERLGLSNIAVLLSIIGLAVLILLVGLTVEYKARHLSFFTFLFLLVIYVWLRIFSKYSK